jgi:micrococcal nuclease
MKKYYPTGILILFLLVVGCGGGAENKPKDENGEYATVEKITDGDTFSVIFNGRKEKIRLIGIDTPESRRNDRSKKQGKEEKLDQEEIVAMGKEAKAFISRQIQKGDRVKLEFDVQERDKYGRFLCYVYLDDGRMLNEIMIGEGYAYPLTIAPNVKYESKFREAFVSARENSKGLWKK